jgi:hypothetical protein
MRARNLETAIEKRMVIMRVLAVCDAEKNVRVAGLAVARAPAGEILAAQFCLGLADQFEVLGPWRYSRAPGQRSRRVCG